MQKWEYRFVSAELGNSDWRVRFIDGKEVANWKTTTTLYDYANKIGDEGWELVSAPYTSLLKYNGSETIFRLIFKRPKS